MYNKIRDKMSCRSKKVLLVICVALLRHVLLPSDRIQFEVIDTKEGLSQRIVYSIIQDKFGFIWFGTRNGLNRYDGNKIIVHKHQNDNPNSLSNNLIRSISSDSGGNLWIGTWGGGINKYNPETEQFSRFVYNPNGNTGLRDNFIIKLVVDSKDRLWIASQKGLQRYDINNNIFNNYLYSKTNPGSISSDVANTIMEDSSGSIWVGTSNGLNRFDPLINGFIHYMIPPNASNDPYRNQIRTIFEDHLKRLWIGTENGELFYFLRSKESFEPCLLDGKTISSKAHFGTPSCIAEDSYNNIWIGTIYNGLYKYDFVEDRLIHYKNETPTGKSISDNRIKAIFSDQSASLWVGTDTGINKFSPYRIKFMYHPHDSHQSTDNIIRSIFEDGTGTLFVGLEMGLAIQSKGKEKINSRTNNILIKHFAKYKINVIFEDHSKNLWFGTNSGLIEFVRKHNIFKEHTHRDEDLFSIANNSVWAIYEHDENTFLIGTKGGLDLLDKKAGTFKHYTHNPDDVNSLCCNFVHFIFKDSFDELWVGTDDGIDKFDLKKGFFKHYKNHLNDPYSLSNNNVWSIYEDEDKTLWVGSLEGLNKYNKSKDTFYVVSGCKEFSDNQIFGILGDKSGNLWISSDNGLFQYNPKTNAVNKYDNNDGLQSNEFGLRCCFKGNYGELFFGGNSGFNSFFPESVIKNNYIPPIVITEFKLHGKPVRVNGQPRLARSITAIQSIDLSYRENFISFEFAALDFTISSKNKYSYKLEGLETQWSNPSTENSATYTNLPHGKYIFRVKGANHDGKWNENGASIKINIHPPFWLTWWFKSFVYVFIIAFVVALYRIRIKVLKDKIVQQEGKNQIILSQKMKLVGLLAAGATHDLGNLLFTIVSYSRKIALNSRNPEETVKVGKIKTAAEKAIQIVKQILVFSQHGNDKCIMQNISLLTDEVIGILFSLIPKNIDVKVEKENLSLPIDPIKYQQIVLNLILNSVAAMPDGGILNISVAREGTQYICIKVEDTGCGIAEANIKNVFTPHFTTKSKEKGSGLGLFVVKQIVDEYKGEIGIKSILGKGTQIKIYFPKKTIKME
jgi:two-component system sensor histidine kinase ChiS